jgi:two-component system, NtrC family, sensor kinase
MAQCFPLASNPIAEYESLFQQVFEASADASVLIENGRFIDCNPAMVAMMRCQNKAEFLAIPPAQLLPALQPDGQPSTTKAKLMIETALTEGSHRFEWLQQRLSGDPFWVEVLLTRINWQGRCLLYATLRDISEKKSLESKHQSVITKLRRQIQMLDACHDAIIIRTVDGMITYWNQGAQRLYGWPKEDCIGTKIQELLETEFPEPLETIMAQLVEQGYWEGELVHRTRDRKKMITLSNWVLHRDMHGNPIAIVETNSDITARKQAEQALQRSEAQFQRLAKNAPGMIYQFRLAPKGKMRFVYVSPVCQEIYEIEPALVLQDPHVLLNLVHPDDQLALQAGIAHCAETLAHWSSEHRIITPSGQQKWLWGVSRPEKQSDGTILWDGMLIDISARKAAEAALAEREKQFRHLSDNVPGMVYRYVIHADGSDSFPYISSHVQDVYGVTDESVMQDSGVLWRLLPPDDVMSLRESISECIQTGLPLWSIEHRIITPRGEQRWIRAVAQGNLQPNGDIIWDGFAEDVSKRKVAEEKLQNQTRRENLLNHITSLIRSSLNFNTILATTVEIIHDFLEVDSCSFSWYRANDHIWETVHQARTDEIPNFLGQHDYGYLGTLSDDLLNLRNIVIDNVESLQNLNAQDTFQSMDCSAMVAIPMRTASGEIGVISCHQGTPRLWTTDEIALLRSVIEQLAIALTQAELYVQSETKAKELAFALAELKKAQSQIIQAEKMSSLGQLVAGIAHEINNPVSFIYGNLAPAQDYSQDLLDLIALYQTHYPNPCLAIANKRVAIELDFIRQDLPKLLASMQMGADRIASIVSSLRTFSHLDESGCKAVNLHEGLDSTLVILASRLKAHPPHAGIEVIKQYGHLPRVECYGGQINQVFMNLLVNAIDALEAQNEAQNEAQKFATANTPSTITISTELISTDRVAIRIADNGIGMPEEIRHRIFDPFFTTKPVGKGTGMGLSISYKIITENHRGSLVCQSTPGQGTEFVIEIPLSLSTH